MMDNGDVRRNDKNVLEFDCGDYSYTTLNI